MSGDRLVDVGVDDDGVGRLRLTCPANRNAFVPALPPALVEASDALASAAGLRAVLISAEGPAFSVGGDVKAFAGAGDRLPDVLGEMIADWNSAIVTLAGLPVPVVCAVQGGIGGGGAGFLYAADIVVAATDFKFACGFAALGVSGDGGGSWFLPRLVGLRRAQELMLENRVLDAQAALGWGLVTRVVEPGDLLDEAERTAARLAAGPTQALGRMRRLLREGGDADLRSALDAELVRTVECARTQDAREGFAAFAERRPPRFTGG